MTYIQLQSTSSISDESNYIAYSGASFAGSSIPGAVVEAAEPINPKSGQGFTPSDSFTVTYDFNRAANNALLVAADEPA